MLIIILRYEVMIFIGCASPAGLSNCFFIIDTFGSSSSSRFRFEPIEQRLLLVNSKRYNGLKKSRGNHQEWGIRIRHLSPFLCNVINTSSPMKEIKHFFTHTRINIHIIFNIISNITNNTITNIIITIITLTIIIITIITITIIIVTIIIITINVIIC